MWEMLGRDAGIERRQAIGTGVVIHFAGEFLALCLQGRQHVLDVYPLTVGCLDLLAPAAHVERVILSPTLSRGEIDCVFKVFGLKDAISEFVNAPAAVPGNFHLMKAFLLG